MLLVQDQYMQNSRKNFDTELQFKQDTSRQLFSEPKEFWEFESGCEEEILTSGNETEAEENIYQEPPELPEEVPDARRQTNPPKKKPSKNVRFESLDFNYVLDTSETSSLDNEYLGIDCGGYGENEVRNRRRSLTQEPEPVVHKVKEHLRVSHKPKCRTVECGRRPKSNPERTSSFLEGSFIDGRPISLGEYNEPATEARQRTRRKEHRCGRLHHEVEFEHEAACRKLRPNKFEYGDDGSLRQRRGDCCDYYPVDEGRSRPEKKNYVKIKPTPSHRHMYHKDPIDVDVKGHRKARLPQDLHYDQTFAYHTTVDRYYPMDEYHEHAHATKNKKKILEAVQEQQEQLSDSTYKIPCSKFSSQTIPGELTAFRGKRSLEKLANSSQSDWFYCGGKGFGSSFVEKMRDRPMRIHKMRSRRTRMNRIKNGWKKALVQTVRDGNRNERVGVIVMSSKGPEFYSKNVKNSEGIVPFRKSKSFLDGAAKSFEVMTIDCKNVFLSSSEPGPRTNYAINDLICPEDDAKVEEKIEKFSQNVNEIVKNSEEKFYKALSSNEFHGMKKPTMGMLKGAGEGCPEIEEQDETVSDPVLKGNYSRLLPVETPRMLGLKKPEKKINEESKTIAEALNEKARQYKENQSSLKDKEESFLEEFKELQKYPPKETSPDTVEENLSLWRMKLDRMTEETGIKKQVELETEGRKAGNTPKGKEKTGKDEMSQSGSVKSTEQISLNKQRRKKYYESTISGGKTEGSAFAGDAPLSKPEPEVGAVSKTNKRLSKLKKWTESQRMAFEKEKPESNSNMISAVFRDLVENGCAISQGESENLQNMYRKMTYPAEARSNGAMSSSSSEEAGPREENKINEFPSSLEGEKEEKKEARAEKRPGRDGHQSESCPENVSCRKVSKMKNYLGEKVFESKLSKKVQGKGREGKTKKKIVLENKMRLLRETLPSIAAENEAAHLKQLKKYIDRFIDRVEASTTSEFRRRKENRLKSKESASTDSSDVKVDARKILDFVSNPFKKISSDVTINIAKKLTDALVQEKTVARSLKTHSTKARKNSEDETDDDVPPGTSSGSEQYEEPEPTYLKQLKKMRNEHLNNIVLEVKRLSELLRFLDRCNRLSF